MAKAVDFREFTPRNSRDDLIRRVEQAPIEHAEAVLAAYDLLQRLYEKGVIGLLNGLLSAGDDVVEKVTDVVSSKEAVTGLRLALILGSLVTSIDPEKVQSALSAAEQEEPPSLMSIVKQASSKDARRGMATAVGLLNVLGAALNAEHAK
jgi:uncharacterized protein YjgD (DUF1641 family)